jgi:hypothetical protein
MSPYHLGAGGAAIRTPQLVTVGSIVAREKQRPVDVRQVRSQATVASDEVLDHLRAGGASVRTPQAETVRALVAGSEEGYSIDLRECAVGLPSGAGPLKRLDVEVLE